MTQFSQDFGETSSMGFHPSFPALDALIDKPQFEMTQVFLPQQIVYLTFGKEPDESGQDLFVKTKWYKDDVLFDEMVLHVGSHAKYIYIGRKYDTPSRGKVDVYVSYDETFTN